ncbi:hypothetical protein JOH50_004717 [Rhizobium leguminosarum]|uniref:hypothetical protein n=1 Tax=Rhizobium leguminosarum TaxID=384 RepID=UPI001AE9E3FF|nr:hypothetical protein [Rhizobium leguminosarum]MBP2488990.1 hypothetical protein [Rhizobium leguminosarum]
MLRLVKKRPAVHATAPSEKSPRTTFEAGLLELKSVTTLAAVSNALERGVEFSIDGFRRRNKIGNSTLQLPANSDLLKDLQKQIERVGGILNRGHKKILRGKLSDIKKGPQLRLPRKSAEQAKIGELKELLEAADRDLDRAARELNVALRKIAELESRLKAR